MDSVGGVVTFNPAQELQRPALTLAGGMLYVAYGSYADTDPYHGWIFGYNATNLTLQTNYIFNTTPNATYQRVRDQRRGRRHLAKRRRLVRGHQQQSIF